MYYVGSLFKNHSISLIVKFQGLLQHLLNSLLEDKNHILSITLLLGLREVFKDLFVEADLVNFLLDTKVLKISFIKLT